MSPSSESLRPTQEQLVTILEDLPTKGRLFTAIWPLWPIFIYSVGLFSEAEIDRIQKVWSKLEENSARSVGLPAFIYSTSANYL